MEVTNFKNLCEKVEKKEKKKNDLRTIKQILYDMGPLTLVRWPL